MKIANPAYRQRWCLSNGAPTPSLEEQTSLSLLITANSGGPFVPSADHLGGRSKNEKIDDGSARPYGRDVVSGVPGAGSSSAGTAAGQLCPAALAAGPEGGPATFEGTWRLFRRG